jgi:hypothetical protein
MGPFLGRNPRRMVAAGGWLTWVAGTAWVCAYLVAGRRGAGQGRRLDRAGRLNAGTTAAGVDTVGRTRDLPEWAAPQRAAAGGPQLRTNSCHPPVPSTCRSHPSRFSSWQWTVPQHRAVLSTGLAGARERSSGAWVPAVVLWGVPVLPRGGCRVPRGAAGFLGAALATGCFRGRAWAGRAASSGAARFPVARTLARWPWPRLPMTSGDR